MQDKIISFLSTLFRCCYNVATQTSLYRPLQDVNQASSRRRETDVLKTSQIRRLQEDVNTTSSRRQKTDVLKTSEIRRLQDVVNRTSS